MRTPIQLRHSDLKILAMAAMLLDHMWATIISGNLWMTCLGRICFPIFAFGIAEGYRHTSDYRRYRNRLLIFALISEIPFDLMMSGAPFFIFHQNVLFTLLLGLMAIRNLELLRQEQPLRSRISYALRLLLITLAGFITFPDYGVMGVLTVVLFHLMRDIPHARLGILLGMSALNVFFAEGQMLPLLVAGHEFSFPVQGFAILSLIPIFLYRGEKGFSGKIFSGFCYWFYPAHMLILYWIRIWL